MDKIKSLKNVGYYCANIPEKDATYEDFVRFCKFSLCMTTNTLMLDPVWDNYDEENIIAEYYAHVFAKNPEEANKFMSELQITDEAKDNVYDWLDKMVEENQGELKDLPTDGDDEVDFSPDNLGTMDG